MQMKSWEDAEGVIAQLERVGAAVSPICAFALNRFLTYMLAVRCKAGRSWIYDFRRHRKSARIPYCRLHQPKSRTNDHSTSSEDAQIRGLAVDSVGEEAG